MAHLLLLRENLRGHAFRATWALNVAIVLGLALCVYGITSKSMHPDQMAFRPLFHEDKLPFNPGWFEKPPFHTYFNYFLCVLPLSIIGNIFNIPEQNVEFAKMIWSKLLTASLFSGSIVVIFAICRKSFGDLSASITALIAATSAGFVSYSHFLTADVPVMFWMLVAFFFSHAILFNQKASHYALAGLFTGVAAATKYNGLAIGVTIVAAHTFAVTGMSWRSIPWRRLIFSWRLFVGLSMVVVGFIAGNPFAILDYRAFKDDFWYNYMVAPVYEGQVGHSYFQFFVAITEVIGLPAFILLSIGLLFSCIAILRRLASYPAKATVLLGCAVLLIYYYQFGAFPRLETRFVLPIVPFFLIVAGPFWNSAKRYTVALPLLLVGLLAYNLICSASVGARFLEDPRVDGELWFATNAFPNSTIEADIYSPDWLAASPVPIKETWTPFVTGRERLFEHIFPGNEFINGPIEERGKTDQLIAWYTESALEARRPDFIAINSLYYQRFTDPGLRGDLYPSMRMFFQDLLNERYSYDIVFDKETSVTPSWIYPQNIDFQFNRITVFARRSATSDK